jgi:hypothetical protein
MTRAAFTNGQGAIISASLSILYAKHPTVWHEGVQIAVVAMKEDLGKVGE